MGIVKAVCISEVRGTKKKQIEEARLVAGHGIEGDAHAGDWHRAVSLLCYERFEAFRQSAEKLGSLDYGDFAENIMVSGIDFAKLPVGMRFRCGDAILRMTQIGKECHSDCEIRRLSGHCIMPHEGVFAVVERGGTVKAGDAFELLQSSAVVTVSDTSSKGERKDEAGPVIEEALRRLGFHVAETHVVPDERAQLSALLAAIADEGRAQLVVTTGGTGLSPRDVTPEATLDVADRLVPGIAEAMRAHSMRITPRAMLSRGTAVLRKRTLIVNLPGSPKAVRENWEVLAPALEHGLEILTGAATNCAAAEVKGR